MYKVGELVMHPLQGVCMIDDYKQEMFAGEEKTFYVMHPMEKPERSTVFVPVDSKNIRKILKKDEIDQVLRDSLKEVVPWIDNNNARKAAYNEILHRGTTCRLVAMISRMHRQKEKVTELGKKFPVTDERIMKEAEKRIHQEFSYALHLTEAEIPTFVIGRLEEYRKEL